MAIDNSAYDTLQETYFSIQNYLDSVKLGPEHSTVIISHEQLGELLESFDVEALEEQTKNINALHEQLEGVKAHCDKITTASQTDDASTAQHITASLESVFDAIKNIVL
jgi:hypothetical protein